MEIHAIKTDQDYQAALQRIAALFHAVPSTPEGDELDILTTLVEAYEERNYPVLPPDPIDAILYVMDAQGLSRRDLEPYIGSRARVSEVLNRRRNLSLSMIQRLAAGLGIPPDILIGAHARSPNKGPAQGGGSISTIFQPAGLFFITAATSDNINRHAQSHDIKGPASRTGHLLAFEDSAGKTRSALTAATFLRYRDLEVALPVPEPSPSFAVVRHSAPHVVETSSDSSC